MYNNEINIDNFKIFILLFIYLSMLLFYERKTRENKIKIL